MDTHVRGHPTPLVEWWKDGVVLEKTNSKYEQTVDADGNLELIVNYPHPSDSGKYSCHATNRAGEHSIAQTVVFEGVAQHAEAKLVRIFHADHHRVEQAKIDARGGIPVKRDEWVPPPTPPPEDEPRKERKSRFAAPAPPPDPVLAQSFLPVDYPPIVVETTFASDEESDDDEPLYQRRRVETPLLCDLMRFNVLLTNVTMWVGGRAKFTCFLDGPDQHSRWIKENKEQPNQPQHLEEDGPKYVSNLRHGLLTLVVNDVQLEDAGDYTVVCYNWCCEIKCTARLVVYEKQEVLKTPAFIIVMKGTVCECFCVSVCLSFLLYVSLRLVMAKVCIRLMCDFH